MHRLRGGINLVQAEFLRSLVQRCRHGAFVEVGSYRGKSAVALFYGLADAGGETFLYCVEPHRPFTGVYGGTFGPEDRGEYYRVMLKTGAYRRVALLNTSSEVLGPGWLEPVGFLFIDGDHTYAGVKSDFESWRRHLLAGAHLVFDDSADPTLGPRQLVSEIVATGEFEEIEQCQKVTDLRRVFHEEPPAVFAPGQRLRILVVCKRMTTNGGILRFEKLGRELVRAGHQVSFCTMDDALPVPQGQIPATTFRRAFYERWDVTMVAGSGFLSEMSPEAFASFRDSRFGLRVQHILNDRSKAGNFLRLNESFQPHVVVFNNDAWAPGDFTGFAGNSFHYLLGACDQSIFSPAPPTLPDADGRFIIGAQAGKNLEQIVAALQCLPQRFSLRLFGESGGLASRYPDLVAARRLVLAGVLLDQDLAAYYHTLDCFVSPESHAGWSNASAEALSCGIPLICTAAGTGAFARDNETALLLTSIEPAEIAAKVELLAASPELRGRLAQAGREALSGYGWDSYAQQMAELFQQGREKHYLHAPEHGMFGKWPAEIRLQGLERLFTLAPGRTVLDLGAAEGWIAYSMLRAGATLVHGFELEADRVRAARKLAAPYPESKFHQADLSDWPTLKEQYADVLRPRYSIVLYLGLHHHLPPVQRLETFAAAVALAEEYFAIRTGQELFERESLQAELARSGFSLVDSQPGDPQLKLGPLWLFERTSGVLDSPASL